eukprot:9745-Heterococcus_DN1.PRE.1
MPALPGTMRTSLNPLYCWNSMLSIDCVHSAGSAVANRMLLGGFCTAGAAATGGWCRGGCTSGGCTGGG